MLLVQVFFLQASAEGNAVVADVLAGVTFSNDNDTGLIGTLALTGNATVANVLAGKTFYNTNAKSKQTGTMVAGKKWASGTISKSQGEQAEISGLNFTPRLFIGWLYVSNNNDVIWGEKSMLRGTYNGYLSTSGTKVSSDTMLYNTKTSTDSAYINLWMHSSNNNKSLTISSGVIAWGGSKITITNIAISGTISYYIFE